MFTAGFTSHTLTSFSPSLTLLSLPPFLSSSTTPSPPRPPSAGTNVAFFIQPGLTLPSLIQSSDALSNIRHFLTPEFHSVTFDRVQLGGDPLSLFRSNSDNQNRVRVIRVLHPEAINEDLSNSDPHFVNVFEIDLPVRIRGWIFFFFLPEFPLWL